jgi:hypothetical protein
MLAFVVQNGYGYNMELHSKPRPYWHVDAKWISGIGLLITLGAALLLMTLASLTASGRGVELSATLIASAFSREGLDQPLSTAELDELKRKLAASPTGQIAPIENFPTATISRADLETLTPQELRLKIFRQIAAPIYDQGLGKAAASFTNDPVRQEQFKNDAFVLGLVTREAHEQLQRFAWIALAAATACLAGVMFFSAGWGRVANPGSLLITTALPGALVAFLLANTPKGESGKSAGFIPSNLHPALSEALAWYPKVIILGLVLLVIAFVGKLVTSLHRSRTPIKTDSQ